MDQESNKVTIIMYAGFIDKAELREKVFNGSKYLFLRTVDAMCFFDPAFAKHYGYYHLKKNIPRPIVEAILEYMELKGRFCAV
ncbi:MAG: hypothetical protein MK212_15820 [Saprospiraceae bacterium]|nr:hypothetical protein [Saprospiraceae bacterium]